MNFELSHSKLDCFVALFYQLIGLVGFRSPGMMRNVVSAISTLDSLVAEGAMKL